MLEEGVEVFKEIKNTEPKNRVWTLSLVINIICAGIAVTCFFVFRAIAEKAESRATKAETDLAILVQSNIKDAKDCPKAIRDAEEKIINYYQTKFDNQELFYKQMASELEMKVNTLNKEINKVKNKVGKTWKEQ